MSREIDKFWLVWRAGSPMTKFRHFEKQSAVGEAERLARQNPGETFYVLKTTAAVEAELPPVTHYKLTKESDELPF